MSVFQHLITLMVADIKEWFKSMMMDIHRKNAENMMKNHEKYNTLIINEEFIKLPVYHYMKTFIEDDILMGDFKIIYEDSIYLYRLEYINYSEN